MENKTKTSFLPPMHF